MHVRQLCHELDLKRCHELDLKRMWCDGIARYDKGLNLNTAVFTSDAVVVLSVAQIVCQFSSAHEGGISEVV